MIEFVTASHNDSVLQKNLLSSPIFPKYGLTIQKGYTNIPKAYNEAVTTQDVICYVHHDVYLPQEFEADLLSGLEQVPGDWEVIGVGGVTGPPRKNYGWIMDRGKPWGAPFVSPKRVRTIDELLIITRGGVRFDEQFEQDFYGADICIGRRVYVIPAFVWHNSGRLVGGRTESFYRSQELFRLKHISDLPIQTTSALVS